MARYTYRKQFAHEFEAVETAKGFRIFGPFDGQKTIDASHREVDQTHWVYVTLEGDYPPGEIAAATGYTRVE